MNSRPDLKAIPFPAAVPRTSGLREHDGRWWLGRLVAMTAVPAAS